MRLEREAFGVTDANTGAENPLDSLLKRIGRSALPVVA